MEEMNIVLLADSHQALVLDNARQPSRETSFPPELIAVLEGFPAGILNLVFGIATVADYQHRPAHTGVVMPLDELAKGYGVSI
jgi:hypothetical protein